MTLFWNQSAIDSLSKRFITGKLHHGLLFTGKEGVGKGLLAAELAKRILCQSGNGIDQCQSCKLMQAGTHPDLLQPTFDKTIGVDLIRESIQQLNQKAHLSGAKVLIIENAHLMTPSASNALLKTLEEPTQNTYLLMTSNGTSGLLPTILSRCEKHSVKVVHKQEVIDWLNVPEKPSQQLIDCYWDRPLRLREFIQDDSWQEAFDWLIHLTRVKSAATMPGKLQQDHAVLLEWLKSLLVKLMRSDVPEPFLERLLSFQQLLSESELKLAQTGVNKPLIFEQLISRWQSLNSLS